ncbi:hypothetical protein FACS189468_3100 [Spirochaetia bacterium]|nr:hypothetical protein FACS189468_3100 [Spirochaetia bacterium]
MRTFCCIVLLAAVVSGNIFADPDYFTGSGGADISISVQDPQGKEINQADEWLLLLIKSVLIHDFRKYSAIDIKDSGVSKVLNTTLTKVSPNEFLLHSTVTDAGKATVSADYTKNVTTLELRTAIAINQASLDLMRQLKVELTEAALNSVEKPTQEEMNEIKGLISLAQGQSAEKQGNIIESLNFMYNAVSFDGTLIEASSRINSLSERVVSGSAGDIIRDDFARQQHWKKIFSDFEEFYTKHLPFEIVFLPRPIQKGETDYDNKTAVMQFALTVRESQSLESMKKVLKTITDGIAATKRQEAWHLATWPYNTPLFTKDRELLLKIEFVNSDGKILDTKTTSVIVRLFVFRNKISVYTTQNVNISFNPTDIDNLGNEFVRITHIDGIDTETLMADGFIEVNPIQNLPVGFETLKNPSAALPKKIGRNPFFLITRSLF